MEFFDNFVVWSIGDSISRLAFPFVDENPLGLLLRVGVTVGRFSSQGRSAQAYGGAGVLEVCAPGNLPAVASGCQ
jgi:di/tricarboxylate transporter